MHVPRHWPWGLRLAFWALHMKHGELFFTLHLFERETVLTSQNGKHEVKSVFLVMCQPLFNRLYNLKIWHHLCSGGRFGTGFWTYLYIYLLFLKQHQWPFLSFCTRRFSLFPLGNEVINFFNNVWRCPLIFEVWGLVKFSPSQSLNTEIKKGQWHSWEHETQN